MAMGMLVVSPNFRSSMSEATPGATRPSATPAAIAGKIHRVR